MGKGPAQLPATFLGLDQQEVIWEAQALWAPPRAQGPERESTNCLHFPALLSRGCPASHCHCSNPGQGDPIKLRNSSVKLGYVGGKSSIFFWERNAKRAQWRSRQKGPGRKQPSEGRVS